MIIRAKEKRERALGTKLFLKADRCNGSKCVMIRRPYRPGQHGQKNHKVSEYGLQLQEKQKIQIVYGLNNRQLGVLFKKPKDKIKVILEQRLDRVVFLLGFAGSPRVARQFVGHGHILVNGRKVTIPSFNVRVGDIIAIRPESKKSKLFEELAVKLKQFTPPKWLELKANELTGKCLAKPSFEDYPFPFDINLVGQFYSK